MDKKLFETIYNNLKSRVEWCDNNLGKLTTKEDVENLTLKQFKAIKDKCVELQSDMDKIYTELNHIYGMGNLDVRQQSKLISMMKKFTIYRSDIKSIASFNKPGEIPNLVDRSEYKLSILADCKLVEDERRGIKVEVSKDTSEIDRLIRNNKLPFIYYGYVSPNCRNQIELKVNKYDNKVVDEFKKDMKTIFNQGVADNVINKICGSGQYLGLNWRDQDGYYQTIIDKSNPGLKPMVQFYDEKLRALETY